MATGTSCGSRGGGSLDRHIYDEIPEDSAIVSFPLPTDDGIVDAEDDLASNWSGCTLRMGAETYSWLIRKPTTTTTPPTTTRNQNVPNKLDPWTWCNLALAYILMGFVIAGAFGWSILCLTILWI